ncbi:palmitoyltransferase ZDHHC20-B-like isoform X3 [Lineus longissimus]|uniref:palmitoyltransferase ZDHHC20-B-like isoform X3 n=1 Tax=Lineus longissimus TaxID=88925 RepID=UPI002B4D9D24
MAPLIVRGCLSALKWAPVIFITAVVVWSYYAYVIQMCIFTVDSIVEKVFYLLLYHPILFFFMWSYWKTIFTDVAVVPKQFFLSPQDAEKLEQEESDDNQRQLLARFARNLPVQCRTVSGAYRYCEKCKAIKPDRGHHCSVCECCVLKMDHHCPWVNNCINFSNYKFFVLFLGYSFLYCIYVATSSLKYFIGFWTEGLNGDYGKFHILFLFFASVMFAISLISLFGYHLYLVSNNRSTLESFRAPIFRTGPDKHGFDLGSRANIQEVFGDDKRKWFLPVFSSLGDGVTYPTRTGTNGGASYNTMGNTETSDTKLPSPTSTTNHAGTKESMGDGVTYPTRSEDIDSDHLLAQRQRWAEEGENDDYGATKVSYTNEVALTERTEERM